MRTVPMVRFFVALTLLAAVAGLSGCGDSSPPVTFRSPCHQDGDQEVSLAAPNGGTVFAVTVGHGKRAVVLVHQAGADHCQWMPQARMLAGKGGQVWAMDSSGGNGLTTVGSQPLPLDREVDPVAAAARKAGATEVVLAGASMGGTLAIAAAARDHAIRVVSLSGPEAYSGADAIDAIPSLTVPVLLVAAVDDSQFAAAADDLAKAAKPGVVTQIKLDGTQHGVDMLPDTAGGTSVNDTFVSFVLARGGGVAGSTTAS